MDEFDVIERLRERFTRGGSGRAPIVDIGDDAAVLEGDPRPLVMSVDASFEGTHFERVFASARDIGYRAHMAAASDLAAMGAEPEATLLALAIAPGVEPTWLTDLAEGFAEAAEACGLRVVGGNVSAADRISLTTTVTGRIPVHGRPLCRAGARAGDDLYVSGQLGLAALGLASIRAPGVAVGAAGEQAAAHWRRPQARVPLGLALRQHATSAIDLSDGLLQDLSHLARASAVGLHVTLAALPTSPGFHSACAALGLNADDTALTGGEDYQLAFTAPPAARASIEAAAPDLSRIGVVVPAGGVRVLLPDGTLRAQRAHTGFRHGW
jgi:thiamine-monophosphate kinase